MPKSRYYFSKSALLTIGPALVIVVSLIVMLGWFIKSSFLVQLIPQSAPMQFNTALSFLLVASAAYFTFSSRKAVFAASAATICLLLTSITLAQFPFNANWGIDVLFIEPFTSFKTSHPGRMAPNTAIAFITSALSILLISAGSNKSRALLAGILATFSLANGLLSIVGYAIQLESVYGWGVLTRMAFLTSLCHLLIASTILIAVDSHLSLYPSLYQKWHLGVVAAVGTFVSVCLWLGALSAEGVGVQSRLIRDSDLRKGTIQNEINKNIELLRAIERFFASSEEVTEEEFHSFVDDFLKANNSIVAIDWAPRVLASEREKFEQVVGPLRMLNANGALIARSDAPVYFPIQFSSATNSEVKVKGFDHFSDNVRAVAMQAALQQARPRSTEALHLFRLPKSKSNNDFLIVIPVLRNEEAASDTEEMNARGFIIGVFRMSSLISHALHTIADDGLGLNILPSDSSNGVSPESSVQHLDEYITYLDVAGRRWIMQFKASEQYLEQARTVFPSTLLSASLLLTLLTCAYVAIARRKDVILRESEERVRLATSHVGIWDWRITNSFLHFDRRMFELYGIKPDEFNNRYEDWAKLVVPEDLPFIEEEVKRALAGTKDYDASFRIIRSDGSIRYMQGAGLVQRDEHGEPIRMIGTNWDITDLKETENRLAIAKEAAESATLSKSQFLANMSHEIRTPLTSVLGYAELLLDEDLDAVQRKQAIHTILDNGEHLLRVINDILDLSKIEARKLEVENVQVSLVNLLSDIINFMAPRVAEKKISFGFEYDLPIPQTIHTDPTRLKQILINLIGNAIKFTSIGGVKVIVKYLRGLELLQFSVIDTGIGLSAEDQKKLFQSFSQADASVTRKFGGTGLGLMISAQLAERLGGNITVESAPGRGSVFTLTIATGEVNENDLAFTVDPSMITRREAKQASDTHLKGSVLVAEDGLDNQRYISFLLKKMGLDVTIVENGKLALQALQNGKFDLVLMDMQMPELDGVSATKIIRESGNKIPILALTANSMKQDVDRCFAAGCSDFLGKPFKRTIFVEKIEKLLQGQSPSEEGVTHEVDSLASELKDDPGFIALIKTFVSNLSDRYSEIEQAFLSNDFKNLEMFAHRLKGAASYYGYPELSKAGGMLEQAAKNSDKPGMKSAVQSLGTQVQATQLIRNS